MVITILLIAVSAMFPIFMVIMGRWLLKNAPRDINYVSGYRTKRSTASKEAWDYANVTSGKYWFNLGLVTLPIFAILGVIVAIFIDHDSATQINVGIFGIMALQLIPFLSVIPYTEKKLKMKFN